MADNSITVFAFDEKFLTVIALAVSAFVSVHICYGQNTKKARQSSIILLLLLMVATQYYHLGNVVTYIPSSRFFIYDGNLLRRDCQKSGKGGKRTYQSFEDYDKNPCYCNAQVGTCIDKQTGQVILGDCPRDDTAICVTNNNSSTIPAYLDENRNCRGGQAGHCSKDQPCYPCELSAVVAFGVERCRTCSTDFTGECNFIPDIGPYCFESPNSRKVVACKRCCTEPAPGVIVNGTCY